jgi:hypothetical protein
MHIAFEEFKFLGKNVVLLDGCVTWSHIALFKPPKRKICPIFYYLIFIKPNKIKKTAAGLQQIFAIPALCFHSET